MIIKNNFSYSLLLCIVLLFTQTLFAQNIWQQTSGPEGGSAQHVYTNGPGRLIAAGGMNVFRSIDNGASWTNITYNLQVSNINAMDVNSTGDIFVGSYMGSLYRLDNNSTTWQDLSNITIGTDNINTIAVDSSGNIFASTVSNLYRSPDNGDSWTALTLVTGLPFESVDVIHVGPNGRMFAGNYNGIQYSDDSGDNWTTLTTGTSAYTIAETSTGGIYLGSFDGIRYAPDTGGNFSLLNSDLPTNPDIRSLVIGSTGTLYAGAMGGFYVSINNGNNWSKAVNGLTAKDVYSLSKQADNTLLAGTENGLFITSNDGANWSKNISNFINTGINQIIELDNGSFFAACDFGLFQSVDDGETWTAIAHFDTMQVRALLQHASGTLFAGTGNHGLWRSTDNGVNWNNAINGLTNPEVIALETDDLDQLYATNYSGVYRSTDNGVNWSSVFGGYEAIDMIVDENSYIYFASYDGIYRSTNNGTNWSLINTSLTNVNALENRDDGYLYAGTMNGMFRSNDLGVNWTLINTGLTTPNIRSLLVTRKGHIFAGADSGQVFLSTDLGDTWSIYNSGISNAMVHTLVINDNSNLLAGTKGSGIFSTIYDNAIFSVNPTSQLDFGNVRVQVGETDSLEFTNIGYLSHQIQNAVVTGTDANAFSASINTSDIQPSGTGYVNVEFNPQSVGQKTATLEVTTSGGNIQIGLTGIGVSPILNVAQTSLEFDSTRTATTSIDSVFISNTGTDTLNINQTAINGTNPGQFSVGTPPAPIPPTEGAWLKVYFVPSDTGSFSATLNLLSDSGLGQVALTGIGIEPQIAVSTNTLDFGDVSITNPLSLDVTVSNAGNTALNVSEALVTGTDQTFFNVSPQLFIVPAGGSQIVSVTFSPDQVRSYSASLAFFSDAGEQLVALSGNGINASLETSPDSLYFGIAQVGASVRDTLYLNNTGTTTVTISSFELSGANASAFSVLTGTPLTIGANSTFALPMDFAPQFAGFHIASLLITSDGGNLSIPVTGTGTEAIFNPSTRALSFADTDAFGSNTRTLTIVNEGNAELAVSEYFLTGTHSSEFQIPTTPITLASLSSVDLSITFVPQSAGAKNAEIVFFSNSPSSPDTIALSGNALDAGDIALFSANPANINFTDTQIGSSPASPFFIINNGTVVLNISEYFVTGTNASEFQFTSTISNIQPADSSLFSVSFVPTSIGSKSASLVFFTNSPTSPDTVALSGYATESTNSITIKTTSSPKIGNDYTVNIQLESSFAATEQTLFYRNIGKLNYTSVPLQGSGTEYTATIPQDAVLLRGLEYYIVMTDTRATYTYPPTNPASNPVQLGITIDSHTPPITLPKAGYKMISFPCDMYETTIAEMFEDDYGEYDNTNWRLFYYHPMNDSLLYQEYPFDEEFFIYPGMAFWLINKDGKTFDIDNASTLMYGDQFTISLMPGWNMVGNPFDFPVYIDDIETLDSIEDPVAYNGTEYVYRQQILQPWEGYFVYNPENTYVQATIPAIEAGQLPKANDPMQVANNEVAIQFTAKIKDSNIQDTQNFIGLLNDATDNKDKNDFSEAPPVAGDLQLYIADDERSWAGNFKSISNEGQQWQIVLKANSRKSITLGWQQSGTLPDKQKLYIFDQTTQAPLKAENGEYTLSSGLKGERRFKVILGTEAYALNNSDGIPLVPVDYELKQNYPNPFNPETVIPFQLSVKSNVKIEVFNILGHKIKTLHNSTLSTGSHQVTWDGSNDAGNSVAAGMYFYRIQAGSFQAVKKMILIR